MRAGGLRVHTHCNAGGLACVEWGTALGIVRALHERGELASVTADETRPLLQGARLTAFELVQLGIDHWIVVDGAGPSIIARGLADAVVVGADRIAANGDVANKIGTYPLALAAARAGIPFVVAAPESTLDPATASGADIEIEERDGDEVLGVGGRRRRPGGVAGAEPGVRRHPGRPRDGHRHRAPDHPPRPRRAPVSATDSPTLYERHCVVLVKSWQSDIGVVGERAAGRDVARLHGRTVVVTGVSSGIGRGIAQRFADAGASLVLHCRHDRACAEVLADELGERATVVVGDLLEPGVADGVATAAMDVFGRLDAWVSNAGVQPVAGLLEMDEDEFAAVVAGNLTTTFLATRAAAARARRGRGDRQRGVDRGVPARRRAQPLQRGQGGGRRPHQGRGAGARPARASGSTPWRPG